MFTGFLQWLVSVTRRVTQPICRSFLAATRPVRAPHVADAIIDLARSKPELILENALLRQQLIILQRGVKRPRCTPTDRALLVLLASRLRTWRAALLIVQPDTLLHGIASSCVASGDESLAPLPSENAVQPQYGVKQCVLCPSSTSA